MNEQYYISSGLQNKMYTLRIRSQERVYLGDSFGSRMADRDWYVKNLSIDKEMAIEKAKEFLPEDYEINFDLGEIHRDMARASEIPVNSVRFGKYFGMTVEEIKEKDPKYLLWVSDNFSSKKHEQVIEYIKQVMAKELEDRNSEFSKEMAELEKVNFERAKILSEIGEELVKLPWDFPQNIGKDMIGGSLPKGRGKHLVCDMMGKRLARRNSKVYKAEYSRVEELVEIAEAI